MFRFDTRAITSLVGLAFLLAINTDILCYADSIVLKNGQKIVSEKCWEEKDQIKCQQHGATVGYLKTNIAEISKISGKNSDRTAVDRLPKTGIDPLDSYRLDLAYRVNKLWKYDAGRDIDRNSKIEAAATFKVLPNGEVKDIEITPSGNKRFDRSVRSSIKNATPFPPHPEGVTVSFVILRLRFVPFGIR